MTRRRRANAEPAPTVRCAVYTRKSVAKGLEQEFNSLDAQREACERYVDTQAGQGWALLDTRYDDGGFTGANLERPAFQRLLADIDAGLIDLVVVYKVDRLSRSLLDFAKVMERFANAGCSFVSVTQNFSTADAIGRLTLNMLMSFAEFEREMISERTRDKIAASRRRGQWTGGPPPLGYRAEAKALHPVEAEAALVRRVFDLYLQHGSSLPVVRALNLDRQTTKQHASLGGRVRTGRRWTKQAVLRTLRNPIYVGLVPYGDDAFDGRHDAIVDRAVFDAVQARLDRHTNPASRTRNPDYVLRGLLRCGGCGAAMTPGSTRKGDTEYRYYRCVTRDKAGRQACGRTALRAERIERVVVDQLRELARGTPGLAAAVRARLEELVADRRTALRAEATQLPGRVAQLAAERARASDALISAGPRGRDAMEERLRDLAEALETAEARQREIATGLERLDEARVEAEWVGQVLADFDGLWSVMTVDNRGRLLRAVVRDVVVHLDGEVVASLAPLDLAEAAE